MPHTSQVRISVIMVIKLVVIGFRYRREVQIHRLPVDTVEDWFLHEDFALCVRSSIELPSLLVAYYLREAFAHIGRLLGASNENARFLQRQTRGELL